MTYVNPNYDPENRDKQIAFLINILERIIIFGTDSINSEDLMALSNIKECLPEVTLDTFRY